MAPWKARVQRAEEHLDGLTRVLPCNQESFDPYESYLFCKSLEPQIPEFRESLARLKTDVASLEADVTKRKSEGRRAIDHDFDLRIYNFQNRLRRTDTVLLLYYDSTVSH